MCFLEMFICHVDALQCRNPLCVNIEHVSYIHRYATDLTEACLAAAEHVLPKTTQGHSKRNPGWDEFVRPAREKSLFWHDIWSHAGRPRTGVISRYYAPYSGGLSLRDQTYQKGKERYCDVWQQKSGFLGRSS